jgi:hypothetical protein
VVGPNGTAAVVRFLRKSGRHLSVTMERDVSKRCPYVEEKDVGAISLVFRDREAPEMYAVAEWLDALGEREPITHEAYTAAVAAQFPEAQVVTTWITDVWRMTVVVR